MRWAIAFDLIIPLVIYFAFNLIFSDGRQNLAHDLILSVMNRPTLQR